MKKLTLTLIISLLLTVNARAYCSGTALECDNFNADSAACNAQTGCSYTDCSGNFNETDCTNAGCGPYAFTGDSNNCDYGTGSEFCVGCCICTDIEDGACANPGLGLQFSCTPDTTSPSCNTCEGSGCTGEVLLCTDPSLAQQSTCDLQQGCEYKRPAMLVH